MSRNEFKTVSLVILALGLSISIPYGLCIYEWDKPAIVVMKPTGCAALTSADISIKWINPDLCQARVQVICQALIGCRSGYKNLDGSKTVLLSNPSDEVVATTILKVE